jgi:hypothetical protein
MPAGTALAAVAVGGLSFLPWLPRILAAATSSEPYWTPIPGLFDWILTLQVALVGWRGDAISNLAVAPLLLLAVAGLVALSRSHDGDSRLLAWVLVAGVALVPTVWLVSLVHSIYDHRYFGAVVAPLSLAVAAGAGWILDGVPRWHTGRAGAGGRAVAVALAVVCLLGAPFALDWLDRSRSNSDGSPVKALIETIAARILPGDSLLATDALAYFPAAYEVARAAPADPRLRVPVLHWVSGHEMRYNGASLIDAAADVDGSALERLGWHAALRLGSQGRVWLIASGTEARADIDIAIVHDPSVTVVDRVLLGTDRYEPAQAVLLQVGRH